ncbi:MAG: hypothetical protein MJ189_05150, partial [Coriobacteriales bacterium]|nr:hypothetical protein [Coriobacteriales bacterium]
KSVIDEGLITKALFINFDVDEKRVDDEVKFLILKAEKKRKEILEEYLKIEKNINPLVLIQFPSESPNLMEHTLNTLSSIGKSVHNGLTGVWMADNHMNTDDITLNDAPQQYLLVKQAISKGWDCPRAKILIKLREHMSEDFELQTLGRLRRMPEAMHYENEVLDNSYLYTFDEKFKEAAINIGGLEHVNLKLKKEFMRFSLKKELRSHTYENLGERETRQKILEYFIKKYNLVAGEYASNLIKFEENGYETSQQLLRNIVNDSVEITSVLVDSRLNRQDIYLAVDTHIHGRFLQQNINSFRTHLRLDFDATKALFKNLFRDTSETDHLLQLTNHEFYAFIINNASLIRKDLEKCMSNSDVSQNIIKKKDIIVEEFSFPETMTYSIVSFPEEKHTYEKNIYDNYTNQLTKWAPEKSFEQWCDKNADWFFKNGDHGNQYLSIVYRDGLDNLDLFFPDYILEIDSELWIIETKGGQSTGGNDENIDSFASQKFDALKRYSDEYGNNFGFVRPYDNKLWINFTQYKKEISGPEWIDLDSILD